MKKEILKTKEQVKHLLSKRSKLTDNQKRTLRRLKEPQSIRLNFKNPV